MEFSVQTGQQNIEWAELLDTWQFLEGLGFDGAWCHDHLIPAGTREVDGVSHPVLHLSFEGVGLTPGDQYWVYVDPETDLPAWWAYRLESMEPDAEPVMWSWEGWETHGGIRLASRRAQVGSDRVLDFSPIEVAAQAPPGLFAGP